MTVTKIWLIIKYWSIHHIKGGLIKSWVYLWWLKLTSSCFRICKRDTELIHSSRDSPAFFVPSANMWHHGIFQENVICFKFSWYQTRVIIQTIYAAIWAYPPKKWPRVRLRLQSKWDGWSQIDSKSSQLSHGPLRIGFLQCRREKNRDAVDTSPSFPSKMALARKLWLKICGKWKHQVARYGVYDIIWYYMNYCMWISWAFHVEKLPCYWTIVEHQNPTSTCFARESTKSSPADLWAGRVFCKAACGGSLTMGLTKNVIAIIWYYTYNNIYTH